MPGKIVISGIADEAGKAIQTQIRAHRELGWKLIDLRAVDTGMITDISEADFDNVCLALDGSGLQVANFASGICCWGRSVLNDFELDLAEMRRAIPRMHRLNCKTIRIMSCPLSKDETAAEADWKDEALRRIGILANMAEEAGVVLVHENAGGWAGSDPERMIEMLERANSPALQLLFDMGNFKTGEQCWACYERLRGKIGYLHIKDRTPEGCCIPGEGIIPVARILADLVQHGYEGIAAIEPHIAAMHHTGASASDDVLYPVYLKAARAATELVNRANAGD